MKVVFSGLQYGQLWQNRVFFDVDGGKPVEDVATDLNLGWVEDMRFLQHAGLKWLSIQVKDLTNPISAGHTLPIAKQGAQGEENSHPGFSSAVIRLSTGLAGRKFRGRIYVPGYRHGATSQGRFGDNELTLWSQQIAKLHTKYVNPANTGIRLVIHGEGAEPHDTHVISMTMRAILGVQRRRNIGVGA